MDKEFNLANFKHYITQDCSLSVNIELKSLNTILDVNTFIKSYKISNLWSGKFFIKRLIKKIFKYKIKKKINWDKKFWDLVEIKSYKTNIYTDETSDIELEKIFSDKTTTKRFNDILKYKNLLLKNTNIGNPLYITSECLNLLGAKISINEVFILDGSRRLTANILINKNPDIVIIESKNLKNDV